MLVWNKSDDLKNGSLSIFTGVREDVLLVAFEGVGIVETKRETWVKWNKNGQKIESITQFLIILAYAVTCHKLQGLTLASAVVHCSWKYVPGLIYFNSFKSQIPWKHPDFEFQSTAVVEAIGKSSRNVLFPPRVCPCCRSVVLPQKGP